MKKEEKKENVEVKHETKNTDVSTKQAEKGLTKEANPDFNGPFTLMRHFAEDMERMFADFGFNRGFPTMSVFEREPFGFGRMNLLRSPFEFERNDVFDKFSPPIEMLERDGKLIVRADLPGMEKDDITVEVRNNLLAIEGERKQESEEKGEGFYRSERTYGSFYRELPLPDAVKTEDAKATFKNGVLEVTFAAPELATSRKRLEISGEKEDTKAAGSSG